MEALEVLFHALEDVGGQQAAEADSQMHVAPRGERSNIWLLLAREASKLLAAAHPRWLPRHEKMGRNWKPPAGDVNLRPERGVLGAIDANGWKAGDCAPPLGGI